MNSQALTLVNLKAYGNEQIYPTIPDLNSRSQSRLPQGGANLPMLYKVTRSSLDFIGTLSR